MHTLLASRPRRRARSERALTAGNLCRRQMQILLAIWARLKRGR